MEKALFQTFLGRCEYKYISDGGAAWCAVELPRVVLQHIERVVYYFNVSVLNYVCEFLLYVEQIAVLNIAVQLSAETPVT
jgi:hypothetical protein